VLLLVQSESHATTTYLNDIEDSEDEKMICLEFQKFKEKQIWYIFFGDGRKIQT
jgi:hypothetical protein